MQDNDMLLKLTAQQNQCGLKTLLFGLGVIILLQLVNPGEYANAIIILSLMTLLFKAAFYALMEAFYENLLTADTDKQADRLKGFYNVIDSLNIVSWFLALVATIGAIARLGV